MTREPLTEADAQNAEAARITEWLGTPETVILQLPKDASVKLEAVSVAARAYYQEQGDYTNYMQAWRVYVLAKRRTTELCLQEWEGNELVTLGEMGFTKMQWHRRMLELRLKLEQVNQYFDDCIAKGWNPSIAGLVKSSNGTDNNSGDEMTLHRQRLIDHASWLLQHTEQRKEIAVLKAVIDTFAIGVKA